MPRCPACNHVITEREAQAAKCPVCTKPLPVSGNARSTDTFTPYQSPAAEPSPSTKADKPWERRAAKYSVLAPILMLMLNHIFEKDLELHPSAISALVMFAVLVAIILCGLVLGIMALRLAVKARSIGTSIWAIIGIFLNGAILISWAYTAYTLLLS